MEQPSVSSIIENAEIFTATDGWGDIKPLPPATPEAPSLPPELIPQSLRPWIADITERAQIPLEFVAAPAIVALSSVIGRSIGIYPKRQDDWLVVPNLWGAIIGRPGVLKSPAMAEAMKPLQRLAKEAGDEFKASAAARQAETDVIKLKIAALKDQGRAAAKGDGDLAAIQADLASLNAALGGVETFERRFIVNDPTVEKVGELLNQNPRGLLLVRDELSGWLRNLNKAGREGDREVYLEAWNGTNHYIYDRIGRGTLKIEALTLSIFGTIQPGKLRSYIAGALAGGGGDDGLLQRFQLIVWPDQGSEWKNVDRFPDTEAKNRALGVFRGLDALNPATVCAEMGDDIPALRFSPEAQELFNQWREKLEKRLRGAGMEATPAFESHLAKYRSLMPSLALIFQLVETVNGDARRGVDLAAARSAAAWCDFLEGHARKIYAAELTPDITAAHGLADKIKVGAIVNGSTVRDIYRREWSGLSKPEAVWDGIQLLQGRNWVRVGKQRTEGRPSGVIELHPDLRGYAA